MASRILDAPWLDQFLLGIIYVKARSILKGTVHPDDESSNRHHSIQDDNEENEEPCQDELQWLERFWKKHSWELLYPFLVVLYLRNSQAQTPAVRALGLRVVPRDQNRSLSDKNAKPYLFLTRILSWALLSGAIPFLTGRLRNWVQSRERQQRLLISSLNTINSHTTLNPLAARRQLGFAKAALKGLDRVLPLAKLALLLRCWGTRSREAYNTTDPIMWACGLAYADGSGTGVASPKLQVGFAHRRFVWEEIVRTMRFWLMDGFFNWHVWKSHLPRSLLSRSSEPGSEETASHCCGLCKSKTVVIPMKATCCDQVYCYTCLHEISSGRRGRFCLHCGYEPLSLRDAKRVC